MRYDFGMTTRERKKLSSLGEKLMRLRTERGLSQEEFAEKAGLDRTYISGLERGKRNPSFLALERLAKALEIPAGELLGEE